ncbi:MAG: RNA polymerase sigma factor [Paludisphaera borealis]|uniref:RNA polymerase sigma factor n=1 Tax=Paludisphaera borealis TaxID=1387353 RepID=UPI002842DF0E|nr:RNA polymerase sigma factor [Paludisphaera borealis]MDR3621303.1 RNA polymerase sigma factor [Paludisphaera borealis]
MTQVSGSRQGDYHQAIERLFHEGTVSGLSEVQLLERFAARRDEAAFEALVERHGPMVLGVCRRFLRDPNDVDDAFQAVFLVLVRRAGDIRRKDLLGNWLYGVACRVAVRARSMAGRRPATTISETDGDQIAVDLRRPTSREPDESQSWLHEEVERLPRRYRQPVVACYFEGRTHEEAATLLGCPLGTVKGRLSRARDLLRKRLERRGLAVPAVALAAQLASPDLRAAVPVPLASATVRSGLTLATGSAVMTTSAISTSVRTLTEGVLHAMVVTHIKAVALPMIVVAAGVLAAGATVAARQNSEGKPKAITTAVASEGQPKSTTSDETPGLRRPHVRPAALRRMQVWAERILDLRQRLRDELEGLNTDADKEKALAVHRARLGALIRSIQQEDFPTAAGDEFKKAVAKYLNTITETQDLKKTVIVYGPVEEDNFGRPTLLEFKRLDLLASQYEKSLSLLQGDLRALKSPEEQEAARVLQHARQEALGKDPEPNNVGFRDPTGVTQSEPFRELRAAFLNYLGALENDPEPPPAVAKTESPKAKSEKPAAPANTQQAEQAPAPKVAKGGGAAGGGGFGGGGIGGPTPEEIRQEVAGLSATLAKFDENPKNKAMLEALDQPITLRTTEKSTLGDVLKQIKNSARVADGKKLPVYVDPIGIEEAGASLSSPVAIDLEDVPLRFSLRLTLKQLGLAYCVRDGVLIISSLEGVQQELKEAESELMSLHPEKVLYAPNGRRWYNNGMGVMEGGMGGVGGGMR